jgi:hypothetical protein
MDVTTQQPKEPIDGRQLPGFYVDELTPQVHRQATEAALLRDRRLELAIEANGGVRARMIEPRPGAAGAGSGPNDQFPWAFGPQGLWNPAPAVDNPDMTQRTSTLIATRATPFRPSERLGDLHRKAGEGAILRDGRLEIAIDESGTVSARVVAITRD